MGLVVYALAQFAVLRRMREEEDQEEELQQRLQSQHLSAASTTSKLGNLNLPPSLQTTPPTPGSKGGSGQNGHPLSLIDRQTQSVKVRKYLLIFQNYTSFFL